MIDHGRRIQVAEVSGWYDCGKVDTVLETNLHLLRNGRQQEPAGARDVVVRPPVRVEAGAVVERSTIGPNVTIEAGAVVRDSTLREVIVGAGAHGSAPPWRRRSSATMPASKANSLAGMVAAKDEAAPAP
jgi:glucose-1-phosphate thymidylyltransferase